MSRVRAVTRTDRTRPAEVITPPVAASPASIPRRVPYLSDFSRTLVIRKML
jgi:hypothetical protein